MLEVRFLEASCFLQTDSSVSRYSEVDEEKRKEKKKRKRRVQFEGNAAWVYQLHCGHSGDRSTSMHLHTVRVEECVCVAAYGLGAIRARRERSRKFAPLFNCRHVRTLLCTTLDRSIEKMDRA